MKRKNTLSRLLALILAMAMSLSLLGANVWAADVEVQEDTSAPVAEEAPAAEEEAPAAEEEAPAAEEEAPAAEEEAPAAEVEDQEDLNKCGENLTWSLSKDKKTLTIKGTGAMEDFKDYFYNNEFEDEEATRRRPDDWNSVSKIVIESGVTSIGEYAFQDMDDLKVVQIPATVTTIGALAFNDCYVLYSVELPTGLTSVGREAFSDCGKLTVVKNGDKFVDSFVGTPWWKLSKYATATEIQLGFTQEYTSTKNEDQFLFFKFTPTQNITTTDADLHVSKRGENGWAYRMGWADEIVDGKLVQGNDVLYAGRTYYGAFCYGGGTEQAPFTFTATLSKDEALQKTEGKCGKEVTWKFADGVMTISGKGEMSMDSYWDADAKTYVEPDDFYHLRSDITSVVIEKGVTSVFGNAFNSCSSLATVTIADSVTELGGGCFANNEKLATVTLTESGLLPGGTDKQRENMIRSAFNYTPWLTARVYKDAPELKVGEAKEVELTEEKSEVVVKFTATETGKYQAVTSEGSYVYPQLNSRFQTSYFGNLSVEEANPDPEDKSETTFSAKKGEVWYLRYTSQYGLTGKFSITVNKLDSKSGKCGKELTWKLEGSTLTISGKGKMDSSPWSSYNKDITSVVLEEGMTNIRSAAFKGTKIESVTIPKSVETIGGSAFEDCEQLKSVRMQQGLGVIDSSAFSGCTALEEISIPEGVVTIDDEAFYNTPKVKKAFVPATVTFIGWNALGFVYNKETGSAEVLEGFTIYGKTGSEAEKYAKRNNIPFLAHDTHTFGNPVWTWTADLKSAAATVSVTCSEDSFSKSAVATVTESIKDGYKVYTGTATLDGKTFTDTCKVPIINVERIINVTVNKKKAQTVKLKASANGAKLTYKSGNKKVATVSKKGVVTVKKGYIGKVSISIKAAASDVAPATTCTVTINVNPAKTKLSSVKKAKKGTMTVSWKKNSTAKKYQIQIATDKAFTENVKAVKAKKSAKKLTIKKLKSGKTYYVRIRAVNGKVASSWSAVKSAKV